MTYLLLWDKVTDYERFRAAVERDAERRRLYGCKGVRLLCGARDPVDVVALLEFPTREEAQAFAAARENRELDAWLPTTGYSEAVILDGAEELPV